MSSRSWTKEASGKGVGESIVTAGAKGARKTDAPDRLAQIGRPAATAKMILVAG